MKVRHLLIAGLALPFGQAPGQIPTATIMVDSGRHEEGSIVPVTIQLSSPAPDLSTGVTGSGVILHVDEQELTDTPFLTEYLVADEGNHAVFIPPGETSAVVNLQIADNTWIDLELGGGLVTVNLSLSASHNVIVDEAVNYSFQIKDTLDQARVALRSAYSRYREDAGQAVLVMDLLEGSVNQDFSFRKVIRDGDSRAPEIDNTHSENDWIDENDTISVVFEAGRSFKTFFVRIVDDNRIENTEVFGISLHRSSITNQIEIVCHPIQGPEICSSSTKKAVAVLIEDDDIVEIELAGFYQGYYGRFNGVDRSNINPRINVRRDNGDCIVPFPVEYSVRATGDTQILGNTLDVENFSSCVRGKNLEFNLKPAAELSPGIYTLRFTVSQTTDWKIYPTREYWTAQVCVEGNGIICTGTPTIEHGPLVDPPVIEFNAEPIGGGIPSKPPIGIDPYGSFVSRSPGVTSSLTPDASVYESRFFQPNVPVGVSSHIGVVSKGPNACARFDNPLFLDVLDRYTYGRRVTAKLNNADYQICSGPATDQFYGCNSFAVRSWLDLEEGQPKLTTSAGAEYQMFCVESLFNGVQEDWALEIYIDHQSKPDVHQRSARAGPKEPQRD